MSCRHILAALHFNYNLHREDKVNQDDSVSVKVTYPKFKNGEGTVRSVARLSRANGKITDLLESLKKISAHNE